MVLAKTVSGKREDYEAELKQEERVGEKEEFLQELLPEWKEQRALESTEKRRLDQESRLKGGALESNISNTKQYLRDC